MESKRIKLAFTPLFLFLLLITGCKKEEGIGGTSTIRGKVIVHDFDGAFLEQVPRSIYPSKDEKVYIIYGEDDNLYDENFNTSFDGSYEFKYLQKGKYRLFVYSKDSTGAKTTGMLSSVKIPIIVNVEVKSNGSTVEVPDMIILDNNF